MQVISRKEAIAEGASHYFTGKPCPNGHMDVRYVSSYACKSCAMEHHARYREQEEFHARELAYKAKYREENREKMLEYCRWYWRNHPNAKLVNRASKQRNRHKTNERQRIANLSPEQIEKLRAHTRRTYQKFRPDRLARAKAGRGIRRGAEGCFSKSDIDRIYKMQSGRCAECRKNLSLNYHVDHIMPLSLGGSNWPKNLQCLCPRCNLSKNAKHPLDWARQNGKLL